MNQEHVEEKQLEVPAQFVLGLVWGGASTIITATRTPYPDVVFDEEHGGLCSVVARLGEHNPVRLRDIRRALDLTVWHAEHASAAEIAEEFFTVPERDQGAWISSRKPTHSALPAGLMLAAAAACGRYRVVRDEAIGVLLALGYAKVVPAKRKPKAVRDALHQFINDLPEDYLHKIAQLAELTLSEHHSADREGRGEACKLSEGALVVSPTLERLHEIMADVWRVCGWDTVIELQGRFDARRLFDVTEDKCAAMLAAAEKAITNAKKAKAKRAKAEMADA